LPNDKDWQQRSDEWVKMTHASRLRKEKEQAEKKAREKAENNPSSAAKPNPKKPSV